MAIFNPIEVYDGNSVYPYDGPDLAALGYVKGVEPYRKFGYCLARGTSPLPLWPLNSDYTFPTSATTLTVSSSDANDTAAGSGARSVVIYGLDANWLEQTEVVATAGMSNATTTGTFIRVNRVVVGSVGTYGGKNAGNISVKQSTNTLAYVPANACITQQVIYTVPANKVFVVSQTNTSVDALKSADILYFIRPNANNMTTYSPLIRTGNTFGVAQTQYAPLVARTALQPYTDAIIYANATANTVDVNAGLQGHLYTIS